MIFENKETTSSNTQAEAKMDQRIETKRTNTLVIARNWKPHLSGRKHTRWRHSQSYLENSKMQLQYLQILRFQGFNLGSQVLGMYSNGTIIQEESELGICRI